MYCKAAHVTWFTIPFSDLLGVDGLLLLYLRLNTNFTCADVHPRM